MLLCNDMLSRRSLLGKHDESRQNEPKWRRGFSPEVQSERTKVTLAQCVTVHQSSPLVQSRLRSYRTACTGRSSHRKNIYTAGSWVRPATEWLWVWLSLASTWGHCASLVPRQFLSLPFLTPPTRTEWARAFLKSCSDCQLLSIPARCK